MIRVRTTRGAVLPLPEEARFIELCDLNGAVAKVFFRNGQGAVTEVVADTPEAERYARMMSVKFIPISTL